MYTYIYIYIHIYIYMYIPGDAGLDVALRQGEVDGLPGAVLT